MTSDDLFWAKVDKSGGSDACWLLHWLNEDREKKGLPCVEGKCFQVDFSNERYWGRKWSGMFQ